MTIPKLSAPIILVPGLFGFDRLQVAGCTLAQYFPGIQEKLEGVGNRVLVPWLSPMGSIASRAQELKSYLQRHTPHEAVHIIAHSMGGLDARYMISCLDMANQVSTLTTLGTPHRGTSFADWGIHRLERIVRPILEFLRLPTQAFYDLTRPRCQDFNERVKDAANVRYFSVAARHNGSLLNPEWLLPYGIVMAQEGPNDGVVSLASAQYGESFDVWDGDHFSLVNWLNPAGRNRTFWRDPGPRYGSILGRLADCGY